METKYKKRYYRSYVLLLCTVTTEICAIINVESSEKKLKMTAIVLF